MSRSHQQQHHPHNHNTRGNRDYINPAGPASKPRTLPELNRDLLQHNLHPIRILMACDDEIGIWSLKSYFRYLEQNLCEAHIFYILSRSDYDQAWEGNWNNVRQRVEDELVRARSGRVKYDFGNGEVRYPRGTQGSGGDHSATLPGSRVIHYQFPWERQNASGGQGSYRETFPVQESHQAQNFHNQPTPSPYSSSRAIPTGRSGQAGGGSGTQRRSNRVQGRYDLPYR